MQFVLIGRDGTDDGALNRRMAVREQHLTLFDTLSRRGNFLHGAALLDEGGKMVGSLILCEFASRETLEDLWLIQEPYILGGVWEQVEIHRIKSRLPWPEPQVPLPN